MASTSMVFLEAFLDGVTGGGLFTPVRRPGAATQVFADDDEEQPNEKGLMDQLGDGSRHGDFFVIRFAA